MRQWTFWEWVAYCCLLLGAMIMAADTGVRLAPDLAPYVPHFVHGAVWGFAPLAFVVLATSILLVREFVWHAPSNEGGGVRRSKIPKGLNWLSGYDAFQLATPGLLKEHQEARAAFEKLNQEMAVLAQGWSKAPVDQIAEFENKRDKLAPVLQTAQRKSEGLWVDCWESIKQQLSRGELIAKGFKMPVEKNPHEMLIPSEYWRFLNFTDAYKGAQGQGNNYTGVVIARPR